MENDFDKDWEKFFTLNGWNWEYIVWNKDAIMSSSKNGLLMKYLLPEIVEICGEYLFHGTYFLLKFAKGGRVIVTGFLNDTPISHYISENEKVVELYVSAKRILYVSTNETQIGVLRDRPTSDCTKACYLGTSLCCGISLFSRLECLCCNKEPAIPLTSKNLRFLKPPHKVPLTLL